MIARAFTVDFPLPTLRSPMTLSNKKYLHCFTFAASVLLSTHAASACRYIEQANLEVAHNAQSVIATVDGELNGQPIKFGLDTGLTNTMLLRGAVEKQGLMPLRTRRQLQGVGGGTSIFLVKVKDIAIGGAHAKNLQIEAVDALENAGVTGLIGVDFLMQYDVDLNLADNRIKLFRAEDCQDRALAYWDKDAASVPMEYIGGARRPRVQVKLNGVSVWALIDSGATQSSVDLDTARRLGMSVDAPGVTAGGYAKGLGTNTRKLWDMTFDSFAIGDEVVQHPRMAVMDNAEYVIGQRQHEMILGRDFLRAHHVLLAHSQMLVYFTYNGGQIFLKDAVQLPRVAAVSGRQEE